MMKKKRNGQTEPLLEALRPLDQINSLGPARGGGRGRGGAIIPCGWFLFFIPNRFT